MEKCLVRAMIAVFAALVLCSVSGATGNEYDQGKNLYEQKCQICHGANGKGDGPAAAAFSHTPANFTDAKFWKNDPDKKIENTIRKGKGDMPAFSLNHDEIQDVIDYLTHAFEKK